MSTNAPKIMPLAAALASLVGPGALVTNSAEAKTANPIEAASASLEHTSGLMPNRIISIGTDFLGFIVTTAADGTMLAQHYSHTSHASHASHHSHYSSR